MAITLDTLEDRVLRRLNEANNSVAAQFESGANSTPTTTGAVTLRDYYNTVAAQIARTCLPIYGKSAYANFPANTASVLLTAFTPVSGGEVWAAQAVSYGSSVLQYVGFETLRSYHQGTSGDVDFVASGTPTHWYRLGRDSVGVYPPPSGSSTTLTVAGLAVPVVGSSGSDTTSWLDDSLLPMLEKGICAEVAAKNLDDESMVARLELWRGEYDRDRLELWANMERGIRETFYAGGEMEAMANLSGAGKKAR
jgi:hypothetical protein